MAHPVVWFEVLGNDGKKLSGFYGELFGWKIEAHAPMKYGVVDTGVKGGIAGGVGEAAEVPGTRPWTTFYVGTDDVAASLARAAKLGGKVVMPARTLPGGTVIGVFEDPEGHVVGLAKEAPPMV